MRRFLWGGVPPEERQLLIDLIMFLAVPLAVISLLPSLVGVWLVHRETLNRVDSIQQSRAEITYTSCLATNERHDRTVDQLDKLLGRRKAQLRTFIREAEKKGDTTTAESFRTQIDQLDASRDSTVSLIDALAPFTNCDQLSLDRFGYIPKVEGDH